VANVDRGSDRPYRHGRRPAQGHQREPTADMNMTAGVDWLERYSVIILPALIVLGRLEIPLPRSAGRSRTWTFPLWEEELHQSGMPSHLAAHLITMAALHRQNPYDRHTAHVEKLTGSPPLSIADFVRMHAAEFEAAGSAA
jgi:hypothetical protein